MDTMVDYLCVRTKIKVCSSVVDAINRSCRFVEGAILNQSIYDENDGEFACECA